MNNNHKIVGASLGITGGFLTFMGYWMVSGETPPPEAWVALATAISSGITILLKIFGNNGGNK